MSRAFEKIGDGTKQSLKRPFLLIFSRPLALDGRDGDGPLRGLHRLREAAQLEGLHSTLVRTFAVRRLLGLLLAVCLQRQRHGQGGHQVRHDGEGSGFESGPDGRWVCWAAQ